METGTLLDIAILCLLLVMLVLLALIAQRLRGHLWQMQAFLDRGPARSVQLEALRDDLSRQIANTANDAVTAAQSATALVQLGVPFPVFLGDASLDAFMARALVSTLLECRPKVIVELGSGSSTVLIARTLMLVGVDDVLHLSVDHEARYLDISRRWATAAGVAERVTFVHAPLQQDATDGLDWYSGIAEHLGGRSIDFLFVDGPPAHRPGMGAARYPALPRLQRQLSASCVILLDDANRPGERSIVQRWQEEFPDFSLTTSTRGKGYALLTRDEA